MFTFIEGTDAMNRSSRRFVLAVTVVLAFVLSSNTASAHCDTLNGPVVAAARLALQQGDATPVLKWVKAADEAEIRHAFEQTLAVRKAGPQALDLVDRYFFETLVRVHRRVRGRPTPGGSRGMADQHIRLDAGISVSEFVADSRPFASSNVATRLRRCLTVPAACVPVDRRHARSRIDGGGGRARGRPAGVLAIWRGAVDGRLVTAVEWARFR
jgi:hypothetical protein